MSQDQRIGVMFDRDWAPEQLPGFAREMERLGVDELWVVEDLGWNAGVSAAAAALGATERLRVGIGITPAPLRNAALLAMELATLERIFPGRLVAGVGHGVQEWMESVGARARSPLSLLEETISAVRALLRGERVELVGREVRLDGLELVHPPVEAPPVVAGVVQPKSLALAGRVADGTIIAEGHGPDDLARAWGFIGRKPEEHLLTVFTFLCLAQSADAARDAAGATLAGQAAWLGRDPADVYSAFGPAPEAAARVRELWQAGARSVVLRPVGPEPVAQVEQILGHLR